MIPEKFLHMARVCEGAAREDEESDGEQPETTLGVIGGQLEAVAEVGRQGSEREIAAAP